MAETHISIMYLTQTESNSCHHDSYEVSYLVPLIYAVFTYICNMYYIMDCYGVYIRLRIYLTKKTSIFKYTYYVHS